MVSNARRGVPPEHSMVGPAAHVIACNAPYASGGLGQHLAQLVTAARAGGGPVRYYTTGPAAGDAAGVAVGPGVYPWLARFTPVRFSPGWKNGLNGELFDRAVAAALTGPVATFTGFGGQALLGFGRARELGATELVLQAANSHVDHLARRHAEAVRRWPIESSWLNARQQRRTLAEYAAADVIDCASAYTWDSFVAAGVPAAKLRRIDLVPGERFRPPPARPNDGVLRVVYVGSLSVMKGVPVLVEAFAKLARPDAELTLVGGWGTTGMRRFLQAVMARDPRVKVAPGDPLPHLHRASVCVHPTFEDGFAYAPMEAMATGLPVIVTEDTGMKEHVCEGENGYVVPTGDVDALVQRLEHLAE